MISGGGMKRWAAVAVISIMLLFTGCSTVQVSQDFRPGIDFTHYRTYQWRAMPEHSSEDFRLNNPLLHERFRQAIDQKLAVRGYAQQTPADFLVSYTYSIQTRLESEPYGTSVGFGFGRYYRYGGLGFGNSLATRQYDVGMLAIDLQDAVSGALIWRGVGSERVGMHSTPADTTVFVTRLVDAVLAQFPPR